MNPINFFQGIFELLSTIGNSFRGFVAIFTSIINVVISAVSYVADIFSAFYRLTPFLTVPISVIGVTVIIAFVLSLIKKLPLA